MDVLILQSLLRSPIRYAQALIPSVLQLISSVTVDQRPSGPGVMSYLLYKTGIDVQLVVLTVLDPFKTGSTGEFAPDLLGDFNVSGNG